MSLNKTQAEGKPIWLSLKLEGSLGQKDPPLRHEMWPWMSVEGHLLRGHTGFPSESSSHTRPPTPSRWHVPLASPHTRASHVPNLVLQEVHVPVKQGVGRRQDAHGLHPGATLQLALHRHVGEAGQAEEGPLPEIARTDPMCSVDHHQRNFVQLRVLI